MFGKSKNRREGGESLKNFVVAALGVMEDELNGPVPIEEISFCLRVDFKKKMGEASIQEILNECAQAGICKTSDAGWQLTANGENLADHYLQNFSL